jgi:hypothetical protein
MGEYLFNVAGVVLFVLVAANLWRVAKDRASNQPRSYRR